MTNNTKILIIDDIEDNILTIKALLKSNFKDSIILSAENGNLGIELARSTSPNVILLDVLMPKKDGFAVCRELKKDPLLSDIPIVFVTALKESKDLKISAIKAGAEGFLSKPVDEAELIAIVSSMIKISEATTYKKLETERLKRLVSSKTYLLEKELTTRKQTEIALKKERDSAKKMLTDLKLLGGIFEASIKNAPVPIMIHAEDGEVLNISKTWTKLTGYKISDIPTIYSWTEKAYGKNKNDVIDFIKSLYKFKKLQHDGEFVVKTKDENKINWNFHSGYIGNLPDGRAIAMSIATDVTLRNKRIEEITYLSYHDTLTGLHNRRYYEDNLVDYDKPENYPLTIAISDINGLKLINDAFGHLAGDELLITASKIISETCRDQDLVARIGGDEFIIVMPKTSELEAEEIISKINEKAKKITVKSLELSISFGIKSKTEANENIHEVFRSAEDLMYRVKLSEIPSMRSGAIETILNTLYEKDENSEIHSRTVSEISTKIAKSLKMTGQEIAEIKTAGLLHDIGKIIIPSSIIVKEGKLDEEEYNLIKNHPEIGFRILNSTHDMRSISNIVLCHHERWDGRGYPRGLKGSDIPLQSRIISIADAFDAMTSKRTYREIFSNEQAIQEIKDNAGKQFDPNLVGLFIENFQEIIINELI